MLMRYFNLLSVLMGLSNYSYFSFSFGHFLRSGDFIIHKLKQMGKISQEDMSLAMKEFDAKLGQAGSLSAPAKMLSEPSLTEKKSL